MPIEFNLAQIVGLIASMVVVYSFTHKMDNHLKIYMVVGNILFACHFFMLGAYAGMAIATINCFRVGLSIKFHKSNKMMFSFMSIYAAVGIVVYKEPVDLLPIFSSLVGTFTMFRLSGINLRLVGLFGSGSWLVYDIIFHSIGGIITEISALSLNSITVVRLMRDRKIQAI